MLLKSLSLILVIFIISSLFIIIQAASLEKQDVSVYYNAESISSPKNQMRQGIEAFNVQCKSDFSLVFKSTNLSAACVKIQSVQRLIELGWALSYDQYLLKVESISKSKDVENYSVNWNMHVVDNTSFGADGTKVYDVNGDGYEDIVSGWEQGDVTRLYINPIHGEDWEYIEVSSPNVEDAIIIDIDSDGFQDIVTFSEGDYKRITFHWAPKGENYMDSDQWKSEDIPSTLNVTQWMFGKPMNVDNKHGIDIIVAGKGKGTIVGWLEAPENPRDVSAWNLHNIAQASWVMSVEILDINNDEKVDILISNRGNNNKGIKWFQNPGFNSTALYQPWAEHLIGMEDLYPQFLSVAPINETGLLEIWVPNATNSIFHFIQQHPSGIHWKSEMIFFPEGSGNRGKSAAIGDIDGDGKKDLITTYENAKKRIGVMWSSFDEEEKQWTHYDVSGIEGTKFDFAYLIDIDKDKDLDILTSEENDPNTVAGLGVIWYENPFG